MAGRTHTTNEVKLVGVQGTAHVCTSLTVFVTVGVASGWSGYPQGFGAHYTIGIPL